MPFDANNQWVPGPNDHHIVQKGDRVVAEAGLGTDELTQQKASKMRAAGERRMEALKEEITKATQELETREQALARREAALSAREAALDGAATPSRAERKRPAAKVVATDEGDEDEPRDLGDEEGTDPNPE